MVSFAYPNDRLDWALFSFVILYYQWFPLLDYCECGLSVPWIAFLFYGAYIFELPSKDGNITPEKAHKSQQMQFCDKTTYVWGIRYR